jgi:hypothetical protein
MDVAKNVDRKKRKAAAHSAAGEGSERTFRLRQVALPSGAVAGVTRVSIATTRKNARGLGWAALLFDPATT